MACPVALADEFMLFHERGSFGVSAFRVAVRAGRLRGSLIFEN